MKNIKLFLVVSILLLCSLPSLAYIALRIQEPRDNGGYPITSYHIDMRESGTPRWVRVGKVPYQGFYTLYSYEGMIEGREYEFRVMAQNAAGIGKPTDPLKVGAYNPDIDYIINIQSEAGQSLPRSSIRQTAMPGMPSLAGSTGQSEIVVPFRN